MYIPSTMPGLAGTTLSDFMSKSGSPPSLDIAIELPSLAESKVYSTGSAVIGTAKIMARELARFDSIQVTLEGQTKVALEQMSQISGQNTIEATHTFLKLNMPITISMFNFRSLDSVAPLSVPFNFIIPQELLPQSCAHGVDSDSVRAAHCQLPPSIDTSILASVLPETSTISYYIAVKVLQRCSDTGKYTSLGRSTRPITVMPITPTLPPLSIPEDTGEYQLIRTKSLKKGIFSGKLGDITISTTQPEPLHITVSPDQEGPTQTSLNLDLSFAPYSNDPPPSIENITTKIKSFTFISLRGQTSLARKISTSLSYDHTKTHFSSTVTLSTITPSNKWIFSPGAPAYTRRDSGYETCSITSTSATPPTGIHTNQLQIPLLLPPSHKSGPWLPTFHSCMISRFYVLDVKCVIKGGSSIGNTSLALRVPVQVVYQSGAGANLRLNDNVVDELGVDESLRTRTLSLPDVEFVRSSLSEGPERSISLGAIEELPPGYAGGYEDYVRRQSLIPPR